MVCLSWAAIDEYYTFTATTGTYTPITGTDAAISQDDAISAAIPIGFTFGYGDFSCSEVKISTNGWVGLGTSQTGSNLTNNLAPHLINLLLPLFGTTLVWLREPLLMK